MATASKRSADYDPIEEALDIGASVGRSEERKVRGKHVDRARRGGARRGAADAKKTAEADRKRRAEKQRNANARMRASRAKREEEDKASARRGAFRSGQANAKRQADAQRSAQRQGRAQSNALGSQVGRAATLVPAGSKSTTFASGSLPTGTGVDKVTSSRIILIAIVISSIGVVSANAIRGGTPVKTTVITRSGQKVTVPTHLRELGGVFIMGTVALIVNEFDPGIGLLLGLGLLLDVGVNTLTGKGGLFAALGNGLLGGTANATSPKTGLPLGFVNPGEPAIKGPAAPPGPVVVARPPGAIQDPYRSFPGGTGGLGSFG